MLKNALMLGGIFLGATSLGATELPVERELPEKIQKNVEIIAYMKDVIDLPNQDQIIKCLMHDRDAPQSPQNALNYEELSQQLWNGHYWTPQKPQFQNALLQEIFKEYQPVLSPDDHERIFLANILYDAGLRHYQTSQVADSLEYAASLGHAKAQYQMYLVKVPSTHARQEAENYLFSAAAQQLPEALLTLSDVYLGGHLVKKPKDQGIARALCEAAEKQGNYDAQFSLKVATYTEGLFGEKIDYPEGIRNLKKLAEAKNSDAIKCLNAIMESPGDALMEGNDHITDADLDFLRKFLGWRDEWEDSEDEWRDD